MKAAAEGKLKGILKYYDAPIVSSDIVTDPHSPSQFRAIGPHVNMAEFFDAFGIKEGAPMWRPPALRSDIW